ncbi:MAG: CotH kinase family protein, partial [Desulfobacterales bacterium]|nr:CotH kinase family protein [Desulfobacterales bacterium]
DLNAAGRYDWVRSQMDVSNFRDYHIAQTFIANVDQPGNQNARFWRSQTVDPGNPHADGRWRWLLTDTDYSFDYATVSPPSMNMLLHNTSLDNINSTTLVTNTLVPEYLENDPGATLPLRRLLSNLEFRRDFITRFSDLLNTVFSATYVRAQLEGFRSEVAPSMPEHIARWGFPESITEWDGLITDMDTFSAQRPSYMWEHLRDYFVLTGTNRVTVDVAASGTGKVKVNTILVGAGEPGIPAVAFPWSGIYFRGLPVTVRAVASPGYQFSHWTGDVPLGSETAETLTMTLSGDLSLTAAFTPISLPVLRQYWSFNEVNALLEPQLGAGNGFITVTGGVAADVLPSTGQNFAGANAQLGDVAGTHLRVNNPLGKEMVVRLPTTGVEDAVVNYETRRSGSGAGTQIIAYTTDGTSYISYRTNSVADANPALVTLDFSSIPETDDNADFALRITFEQGTGGTAGNNRFDNLTLNARTLPGFGAAGFPVLTAVPA